MSRHFRRWRYVAAPLPARRFLAQQAFFTSTSNMVRTAQSPAGPLTMRLLVLIFVTIAEKKPLWYIGQSSEVALTV